MSDTCGTCRFAGGSGFSFPCKRHAPIPVHDPGLHMGVYPAAFQPRWPQVSPFDWCGDFEPRAETGASQ